MTVAAFVRVDGLSVRLTLEAIQALQSPDNARRLGQALLDAADEAESEPRFGADDIEAILALDWFDHQTASDRADLRDELGALRKKRGQP